MQLTLDSGAGHFITHYEPGTVVIDGNSYHQTIIISPDTLITDWQAQSVKTLSTDDMQVIVNLQPEIIILGTGETLNFSDLSINAFLSKQHIGFETMDTAAACRTYNILMAEERRVVAALFITR